jgi:hypothetical protein
MPAFVSACWWVLCSAASMARSGAVGSGCRAPADLLAAMGSSPIARVYVP